MSRYGNLYLPNIALHLTAAGHDLHADASLRVGPHGK